MYDKNSELTALATLNQLVSANANGAAIDLQPFNGAVKVTLAAAYSTGTSATLDVRLEESADNANWANANVSFTQVGNAANSVQSAYYDTRAHARYLRAVATIGGSSTPAFAASVVAVGAKKERA